MNIKEMGRLFNVGRAAAEYGYQLTLYSEKLPNKINDDPEYDKMGESKYQKYEGILDKGKLSEKIAVCTGLWSRPLKLIKGTYIDYKSHRKNMKELQEKEGLLKKL